MTFYSVYYHGKFLDGIIIIIMFIIICAVANTHIHQTQYFYHIVKNVLSRVITSLFEVLFNDFYEEGDL